MRALSDHIEDGILLECVRTLVTRIWLLELLIRDGTPRADCSPVDYNVIIIILCQVVHDLVVCQDIIICFIIDVTPELDIDRRVLSLVLVLFDSFNDTEVG